MYKKVLEYINQNNKLKLFLVSFLILYFELALIRYIPSHIRYVGYFSNIILSASFVGIGFGTLFGKKVKLPFIFFPFLLFLFQIVISILKYDLILSSNQVIYFNLGWGNFSSEPIFLLPIIFFIVVFLMMFPSILLEELFETFKPLSAYTYNILGSITGIIFFSLQSYWNFGPLIWFPCILILSFLIMKPSLHIAFKILFVFVFINTLIIQYLFNYIPLSSTLKIGNTSYQYLQQTFWSPYYKISFNTLRKNNKRFSQQLSVNNIGHQDIYNKDQINNNIFYQYPYKLFPNKSFDNVLVIGAGTGNDIAKALMEHAKHVYAIEIDPVIFSLGKQYNPLHPYASSRVTTVITDGREYLVNSKQKFDVIIFALTDSLTLTSSAANLRLESYLFTQESIESAKQHLSSNGVLVLYNYYRDKIIVYKLANLLTNIFGHQPFMTVTQTGLGPAAVLIDTESSTLLPKSSINIPSQVSVPTDDWPFLYLKDHAIPELYWSYLGVICLIVLGIFVFVLKKSQAKFDLGFFFLGAAFMLLETKNVVQFSLLFGSTWITNSFVFTGLLCLVLLAIWIANFYRSNNLSPLYICLFVILVFGYIFPQNVLLQLPYFARLITAIILNFSPVFLANIIFALRFKKTKIAPMAYGANILGSFFGGLFEYTSLIWGYKNLMIFVTVFYLFSIIFTTKSVKK